MNAIEIRNLSKSFRGLNALDSGITNVLICGAVAAVLGIGLGAISNTVMKKTSLV